MLRLPIFLVVLILALATCQARAEMLLPETETLPYAEPDIAPLAEIASDIAHGISFRLLIEEATHEDVAAERAELSDAIGAALEAVWARHGPTSRQSLDMARWSAELHALAGSGEAAIREAQRAAELALLRAPAYAILAPGENLPQLDMVDPLASFVALAARFPDATGDPDALRNAAFEMAQRAQLSKPALVAMRKLQERALPPGLLRHLAEQAWLASDGEALPRRETTQRAKALRTINLNADRLSEALFPKPLTITEVQALLQPDEAYVAFVASSYFGVSVFAITREAASLQAIELGDYFATIGTLRQGMGVPAGRGVDPFRRKDAPTSRGVILQTAWQTYAQLFGPVEGQIRDKRHLIVTAFGDLMSFPFEALVTSEPSADTTFAEADWLVRRHAFTVLPSTSLLRRNPEKASEPNKPKFLGVGNPAYAALAGRERKSPETAEIGALQPLPESEGEVRAIARTLGAGSDAVLVGMAANEAALNALSDSGRLAAYDILLFATHGLQAGEAEAIREDSLALTPLDEPLVERSGLPPLSSAVTADGLFTSSEIARLRLDADLVILSACNSGARSRFELDAYSGLASAFMKAGARTLMVSHWPVVSQAAVDITTRTVAGLDGRPTGRALALAYREALLEVIALGGEQAHPRYWAPFSVFGAP